jgi:hypothetical protein
MHSGESEPEISKASSDTTWPRLAREFMTTSPGNPSKTAERPPHDLVTGVVRRVSASDREIDLPPTILSEAYVLAKRSDRIEFCRKARKLRASHRKNPSKMLQALSELSESESPASRQPVQMDREPSAADGSIITWAAGQTARIGRHGMSLLGGLARQIHLSPAQGGDLVKVAAENRLAATLSCDEFLQVPNCSKDASQAFSLRVAQVLRDGGDSPLRYSDRLELIKHAAARGIGRFEANLLIASVQHRQHAVIRPPQTRRRRRLAGVVGFAIVQTMISWGAWRMLRG